MQKITIKEATLSQLLEGRLRIMRRIQNGGDVSHLTRVYAATETEICKRLNFLDDVPKFKQEVRVALQLNSERKINNFVRHKEEHR